MTFSTIYFDVVKVKSFKKRTLEICSIYFITKSFFFVSTRRCGIISGTGYCDAFKETKKSHRKILKISGPSIDPFDIP